MTESSKAKQVAAVTLSGDKVYLRPIEREDIDRGWFDWINDPETNRFFLGPTRTTREQLVRYCEDSQKPDVAMFAICTTESDRYLGNIRLSGIDIENSKATCGWLIGAQEDRRKGYGGEALSLALRYGFETLDLNRISMGALADNLPSQRSIENGGLRREGLLRGYARKDGKFIDIVLYSILKDDFLGVGS